MVAERSIRTIAAQNARQIDLTKTRRSRRLAPVIKTAATKIEQGKDITVEAVRPNAGLTAGFQKKLDRLIDEMQASLDYWLMAAYRANEPRMAQDEAPAVSIGRTMKRLSRKWQSRFDDFASKAGADYAKAAKEQADRAFREHLKKVGFTVEFHTTPAVNDILQAAIAENVSLIKSIASEHLTDVEGIVMRSVTAGRDLHTLAKELEDRYGVTKRRAATIARQQNEAATSHINRARQTELGIVEAIWKHSRGSEKHPRPSHLAADGEKYKVSEGMLLDGEYILPGVLINCRCYSKSIIPGLTRL